MKIHLVQSLEYSNFTLCGKSLSVCKLIVTNEAKAVNCKTCRSMWGFWRHYPGSGVFMSDLRATLKEIMYRLKMAMRGAAALEGIKWLKRKPQKRS